jgi:invasion protein IalB
LLASNPGEVGKMAFLYSLLAIAMLSVAVSTTAVGQPTCRFLLDTCDFPQNTPQKQLTFSPWTKFCLKGQAANARQVCFTGKDGRVDSGVPVVAAVLIEPENEPKKVLRVTLPLGMSIQSGTRVTVDQDQPMKGAYVICFKNGCMADYQASGELIDKLKKGQRLLIEGINGAGQSISLVVPLGDFAKAYEGPPTDPKVFEAQQKRLQEELQRRSDATTSR